MAAWVWSREATNVMKGSNTSRSRGLKKKKQQPGEAAAAAGGGGLAAVPAAGIIA